MNNADNVFGALTLAALNQSIVTAIHTGFQGVNDTVNGIQQKVVRLRLSLPHSAKGIVCAACCPLNDRLASRCANLQEL